MPDNDGFWCPTAVDVIHGYVNRAIPRDDPVLADAYAYKRNIAYNMQYLQFLNWTLTETKLHSTVYALTVKTFIITSISVIESVLWYVIKKNGVQPKREWELVHESVANPFQHADVPHRHVTQLMKKMEPPQEAEMGGLKIQVQHKVMRISPVPRPLLLPGFSSPVFYVAVH